MGNQGKKIGLTRLDPWRLAPDDEVRKGEFFALGRGRLLGAVLPCDGPFRELALEIIDEVALGGYLARGARDSRYEEGRENARGIVDVEFGAGSRNGAEKAVGERLVCYDTADQQQKAQQQQRGSDWRYSGMHVARWGGYRLDSKRHGVKSE